jgi:hypothetical protein
MCEKRTSSENLLLLDALPIWKGSMGYQSHVSDDLLELYSLDRLSADELVSVEEHLRVCPACQDR